MEHLKMNKIELFWFSMGYMASMYT